jgi:asparagine synthase (glutamine-hydrolysing)
MCGICGMANLSLEPVAGRSRLDAMTARLAHRGPDSQGKFGLPHVALGVRRLSVIDLETGDQPLSNEAGDVVLVYNGEIYNYRELRQQLLGHGHMFRTRSDGEVMAHLYEEKGPDFLSELNGMFALALWDARAQRLILARDRAGEKPLYYAYAGDLLVFASEVKALLEHPAVTRELDPEALRQYFFYGYFPAPRSAFRGIRKLPSASRLVAERGEVRVERYWRMEEFLRPPGLPAVTAREEQALAAELRERLRAAAVSRLVSDVPLGVFLSGGVDSSALVALMSELAPGNVSTFSVAFTEKTFNEEPYAWRVARHFQTRHHVVRADEPALAEALGAVADALDEPLADPAVLPTFLMSRFARREIKVALSGEGSDELFGGYPTYLGARLARHYLRLPGLVRRGLAASLAQVLPDSSSAVPLGWYLRRFLAHVEREPAERHLIWFGMTSPAELDQLLAPEWTGGRPASDGIFAPLERVLEGARFDETLSEMLYLDFRLYLEDNLLVKVDRASMACSLELRTPFLDHRLIEFAAGLPGALKVRGWRLKYLLKKAVEPWLPREIVYRQKRGFSVPVARMMRTALKPLLAETLEEGKLRRQGILNAPRVRRMLEEHWSGRADHRRTLWTVFCFQLWFDRWGGA